MSSAVLVRGANTVVDEAVIEVTVAWQPGIPVDPCALLVAADGRVRGDDDFVFYNQPAHPSGAVRLIAGTANRASLSVDLRRVPAAVTRVVIAGSTDSGSFDAVPGLEVTVTADRGRVLARFPVVNVERVAAMVFGEIYRRGDGWKFRAVGQGWSSGLAGLITGFGLSVDDDAVPASTPAGPPPRPDWYPAPGNPAMLQWWSGNEWSQRLVPLVRDTPTVCGRCGRAKQRPMFSRGAPTCPGCAAETANVLAAWRGRAARVLASGGPRGRDWDNLWAELRYHRVHETNGREALRPIALHHLQQLVAFAFADDLIEQHEVDGFEDAVTGLGVSDASIEAMRSRLRRGLQLARISEGDVPHIQRTTLSLDACELLHLDAPAVRVKVVASGPRRSPGRLIATNTKLRFLGDQGGSELTWVRILEVRPEYGCVVVSATTARGGGTYEVADPEYTSAVLSGVLKIAKRTAAVPRQRDSRGISRQIKAEVWRRDGGACVECRATEYLEFDHVIPWSRGGATSVANLQLLCRRCNLAKGARI